MANEKFNYSVSVDCVIFGFDEICEMREILSSSTQNQASCRLRPEAYSRTLYNSMNMHVSQNRNEDRSRSSLVTRFTN